MSIGDIVSGAMHVVGDVTGLSPIIGGAESLLGVGGAGGAGGMDAAMSSALMTSMMAMSSAIGRNGLGGFTDEIKKSDHKDDDDESA